MAQFFRKRQLPICSTKKLFLLQEVAVPKQQLPPAANDHPLPGPFFLSLAFNLLNVPFMIREIVDGPGTKTPSPQSIKLSGNVEAIDKFLTFCGVAFLAALSDRHGRKPLIAWSAFGFATTNILQVLAGTAPTLGTSKLLLYIADFVDGISSCMTPVCQAYVADCTTVGSASLASNLGVFQGISIGGAFVFAFPIGGMLGAKFGPKLPILMAAGFQIVNGLLAVFLTPESNPRAIPNKSKRNSTTSSSSPKPKIDLSEVNPIRGLQNLLGIGATDGFGTSSQSLLRTASLAYFCLSLARNSLDAQFVNYSNIRFGWSQAQSGPVLVMVGMMMGIVPRILVPLLGLQKCIHYGLLILGVGLSTSGLAPTPKQYIMSFAIISIGFVAVPALQALLANLAPPSQSGALLGAVGSMTELTGAIGSTMYAAVLATFATDATPTSKIASALKSTLPKIQGMHFVLGACFSIIGWAVSSHGLKQNQNHPALAMGVDKSSLSATAALD
eukprot:CAMPEP_0116153796 /NCGR_PEP_ID=MMETSP0329-20121206/21436_1 /TAXON_ID=697910 /ORGANISM="Pseudo-nitzschia arenysensis, Strain B593" /LENGTH=499 /DNA_ID=CAMNT_0003650729 /DNA_START=223 /DNA_END=1722 /DNA_ORIENTATION=-